MTIQFEISNYLYKCLKKRIELHAASELDMLVDKGTVIEQEPCSECISRKSVFDLMRSLTRWGVRSEDGKFNNVGLLYDDVMFGIDKIPSVNPQNTKTGCWIWNAEKTYCKCSECGIGMGHTEYDYCPNCGCRMICGVIE